MNVRSLMAIIFALAVVTAAAFATGQQQAGPVSQAGERMTLTWFGGNMRGQLLQPDTPVELFFEEHFNVNLELWYDVDSYVTEQWMTRIAAGEIPDYISAGPDSLVKIGAVREIPVGMLYEHAPQYMAYIEEIVPPDEWQRHLTYDGRIMGLPSAAQSLAESAALVTRSDWMEAVGYEIPTKESYGCPYTTGMTLAELEELLLRYRTQDPDGNGIQDTYGYNVYKTNNAISGTPQTWFPNIFGAFGIRQSSWAERDGSLVWTNITQEYREALHYLHGWYTKGIIDPEFVTDMRQQATQKYASGQFGAYETNSAFNSAGQSSPMDELLRGNPGKDIRMVYILAPEGPDGKQGSANIGAFYGPKSVGALTSDEKLVKILRIIEEAHTDMDVYNILTYGWEGEHWEYDENGFIRQFPEYTDSAKAMEVGIGGLSFTPMWHAVHRGNFASKFPAWRIPSHVIGMEVTNMFNITQGFEPVYRQELLDSIGDPQTVVDEFFFRAITGDIDIDAQWDAYVERWLSEGGEELTREANRQWKNQ